MKKRYIFLFLIITMFLGISFYKLEEIPGEWWGDISIVHDYVTNVLAGKWPLYFEAGGGPIYNYLIAPLIFVIGHNFIDYKVVSTLVGAIALVQIYLLTCELSSKKTALLAVSVTALAFWFFVWSRTGNYNNFVVNLSAGSVYFVLRFFRLRKLRYLILGGVISSFGLLTYPGTFLLPVIFLLMLFYGFLVEKKVNFFKVFFFSLIGLLPGIIIFLMVIFRDPANFFHGYIGSKLVNEEKLSTKEIYKKTLRNIYLTALMFHVEGDAGFRINVPKSPQLDKASGLFLLIGLIAWLDRKRLKKFPYLLIPLLIFPIPSVLPTHPPGEVPNSLRVLGTLPYIMILVGIGIVHSYYLVKKKLGFSISWMFFLILFLLAYFNIHKYFVEYPPFLPNNNTPFGKIISRYIDQFPSKATVVIVGCCWGEWGQPEPKGILADLRTERNIIFFAAHDNPNKFLCKDLGYKLSARIPIYFIVNPTFSEDMKQIHSCVPDGKEKYIMTKDYTVAWVYAREY